MKSAPKFKREFSADLLEGRIKDQMNFTDETSEHSDTYYGKNKIYTLYAVFFYK